MELGLIFVNVFSKALNVLVLIYPFLCTSSFYSCFYFRCPAPVLWLDISGLCHILVRIICFHILVYSICAPASGCPAFSFSGDPRSLVGAGADAYAGLG